MKRIKNIVAKKISENLDTKKLEENARRLDESIKELDHEKIEILLKEIPGFNMIELINFGSYCKNDISQEEWEEKTIEEHAIDWLEKIMK